MPLTLIPFVGLQIPLPQSRRAALRALLGVSLVAACSGDNLLLPREQAADLPTIRVVKGDGQTGQALATLKHPLEVEVADAAGDPVPDASIVFEFTLAGEGADVSPSPTTTDEDGRAEVFLHLGDKLGLQTGTAQVVGAPGAGPSVTFSAIAEAPPLPDPDNRSPEADYNWHCEDLVCEFTDASSDDDGDVIRWQWDFGDGDTSDQPEPTHRYLTPGNYAVTLIVTDNDGATDESTAHVDVESD